MFRSLRGSTGVKSAEPDLNSGGLTPNLVTLTPPTLFNTADYGLGNKERAVSLTWPQGKAFLFSKRVWRRLA